MGVDPSVWGTCSEGYWRGDSSCSSCDVMAGISTGTYLLTPAYVGSAGLVTPSVRELVALLLAVHV